jgi:hypothetical protein
MEALTQLNDETRLTKGDIDLRIKKSAIRDPFSSGITAGRMHRPTGLIHRNGDKPSFGFDARR